MSTFQKLLHRFLGQSDQAHNSNRNPHRSNLPSLQRSQSLTKALQSRRLRSLEVLKNASCFSCGISEQDRQFSSLNLDSHAPISPTHEYNFDTKSLVNRTKEDYSLSYQPIRQKRRAKTKLIIIRHGERVDALFGESWFSQAFDQTGKYQRFHTNLPMTLPFRQNFQDYLHDPPLTELGLIRSYRTGEALLRTGLRIDYCYTSPSLRCIQTADAILDGMRLRTLVPIRIELGLFECGLWHKSVIPHFMSINELILNRFNIETSYDSIQKSLSTDENEYDYYQRSHFVMRDILSKHENNEMTILFIGHAPSLETLTRQLIGAQPRPTELVEIAHKINYLSLTILEGQKNSWTFVDAILAKH